MAKKKKTNKKRVKARSTARSRKSARRAGSRRTKTKVRVQKVARKEVKRGKPATPKILSGKAIQKVNAKIDALTRLGKLLSIGSHDTHWGRMDLRHVYQKNIRVIGTNLGSIVELRQILDHVATGRLRPAIDRTFPLSDARAAVQYVLDRKQKGKVLLIP